MKSKAIRKSVSAFLCIAMLFALMPALYIGAGAEEEVPLSGAAVTYDFRIRAYPGDAGQTIAYFQDYTQYRKWAYAGWGGSFTYSSGIPDRWHS
ncbi:MAG: hypothetical protein GX541_08205, partial [Clostridiales bacterium]|nr:hypothetical protein [Clostridiales bacterium]